MSGTETISTAAPGAQGTTTPPPGVVANAPKEFDFETLPDEAKKMIKELRDENAKHRTKSKSLEEKLGTMDGTLNKLKTALGLEGEVDPVKQLEAVKAEKEALEAEVAIGQLIRANGISQDNEKYFRFLLSEKFSALGEGDEITEEDLASVVAEAKKVGGGRPGVNTTGIGPTGQPLPGAGASTTPEAFAKMTTLEKSAIYSKDPALYQSLFSAAMEKKLI